MANWMEEAIEAIGKAPVKGTAEAVASMLDEDDRLLSTVWEGNPPLTISAMIGHVDLVNLLLERGVAVDATNFYGNTALLAAVGTGHGRSFHPAQARCGYHQDGG